MIVSNAKCRWTGLSSLVELERSKYADRTALPDSPIHKPLTTLDTFTSNRAREPTCLIWHISSELPRW